MKDQYRTKPELICEHSNLRKVSEVRPSNLPKVAARKVVKLSNLRPAKNTGYKKRGRLLYGEAVAAIGLPAVFLAGQIVPSGLLS
jgi:hypothetical protein